ncbi:hypothetical protein CAURIS_10725 [Corynebacterium auris]|nr:hypothetical protein CAURIS_10725 [Corynebacterium auris]
MVGMSFLGSASRPRLREIVAHLSRPARTSATHLQVGRAVEKARGRYALSRHGIFAIPLFAVEVWADLTPVIRMGGLRRLPENFGAGVMGAEAATWGAISPSLLPHTWPVVAANVAICQGVGHLAGTALSELGRGLRRVIPLPAQPRAASAALHLGMSAVTVITFVQSRRRHNAQVELVEGQEQLEFAKSLAGITVGTLGYGALLAVGEAVQVLIDVFNIVLGKRLPPPASWPLAIAGGVSVSLLFTDRFVVRNFLSRVYSKAEKLDREFLLGAPRPLERERSGSPSSLEPWATMGRQGRAVVSGGPRKRDIELLLDDATPAHEPIRIFIGLDEGRTTEDMVELALAELDRTRAWERSHLAIMSAAGTGWINDFHTSGFEFVGRGDTAIVAMQYSYLPSVYSYLADRESPTRSARLLIDAIRARLSTIPKNKRPALYLGGESLGAYGVCDASDNVDDFLSGITGAVFTGVPGFTRIHGELTRGRDYGSPERLPVVGGGRHVRFCAHPDHLTTDFSGDSYANEWETPRAVFAQHASDPVVWWDWSLAWHAPDWLKEPGSRSVPAPAAQHLDVPDTMRWAPFITFWQVGIDQLTSQNCPSPHGHNYHDETVAYWAAVMNADFSPATLHRISLWIHRDATKLRHPAGGRRRKFSY